MVEGNHKLLFLGLEDISEDIKLFLKDEGIVRLMSYMEGVEEKYKDQKTKVSEVTGLSDNPENTINTLVDKEYVIRQKIEGEDYLLLTEMGKSSFKEILGIFIAGMKKRDNDEVFNDKIGDRITKVKRIVDSYIVYRSLGYKR